MRLLVVEDDKMTREFLTRVLAESGFSVDAAALASEAEEMALEGVHDAFDCAPDAAGPGRAGTGSAVAGATVERTGVNPVCTPVSVVLQHCTLSVHKEGFS